MEPPTRQRILNYLHKHQTASVRELGRDLALTGADIRHHLSVLRASDQVEVIGQQREERGRPAYMYSLSRHVLGDNLAGLANTVLSIWWQKIPESRRTQALKTVAKQLAASMVIEDSTPVTQRLTMGIENLNRYHYQARWEAAASGPRIILGNCPYAAVISEHPELCQMDAYLLEEQFHQTVQQTAKLHKTSKGLPFCEFRVEQKE
jgi:predicted ArsR family transcriptional regulator